MDDNTKQLLRDAFDVIEELEKPDEREPSYDDLVARNSRVIDVTERILETGVYPEKHNGIDFDLI